LIWLRLGNGFYRLVDVGEVLQALLRLTETAQPLDHLFRELDEKHQGVLDLVAAVQILGLDDQEGGGFLFFQPNGRGQPVLVLPQQDPAPAEELRTAVSKFLQQGGLQVFFAHLTVAHQLVIPERLGALRKEGFI